MSADGPGGQRPSQLRFGPVEIGYDDLVLTPRPWTLAQARWVEELPRGPMLELGCGAGHIGLAAAVLTGSSLVQVDRSEAACRWAATNAAAAGCSERVSQRCGDVGEVLRPDERFAVVIADPPYISSSSVERHPLDPVLAIDGGDDGLDLARRFLTVAADHLAPDGSVVLQLGGAHQVDGVAAWLGEPSSPALEVVDRRIVADDRTLALLQAAG